MAKTTRWEVKDSENSFEKITAKIESLVGKRYTTKSTLYNDFRIGKRENSEKELKELFNDKQIKYTFFDLSYEQTYKNDSTECTEFIIVYEDAGEVYIIIDKNSGAKPFLRLILEITKKNQIVQKGNGINDDFIKWLIYMIYSNKINYEINEEKTLKLNTIIGFKGDTDDTLNKVQASGDSLMKILSTLSFLLESSSMKQIELRLEITKHRNIEFKIDINNTISVATKKEYKGAFGFGDYANISKGQKKSLIHLLTYIEVLPILKKWYAECCVKEIGSEKMKNGWNDEKYIVFLQNVAKELTRRIDEKVSNLNENEKASLTD